MKKTLFAVAALALCGTAFAKTTSTSELEAAGELDSYLPVGVITLNVDKTVVFGEFDAFTSCPSMTLNFVGTNNSFSADAIDLEVGGGEGSLAITGDNDAKIYWGSTLTSPNITSVTLASASSMCFPGIGQPVSFEGLTQATQGITLGNATVDYMGFHFVANMDEANALITGDNQIALVAVGGEYEYGQLALIGKGTAAAAPEPATATLSLLALAGLASRRRRH